MKTTVRQDMKNGNSIVAERKHHTYASQTAYLRGANSIVARSILLLLMLLAGGVMRSTSGRLPLDLVAFTKHSD